MLTCKPHSRASPRRLLNDPGVKVPGVDRGALRDRSTGSDRLQLRLCEHHVVGMAVNGRGREDGAGVRQLGALDGDEVEMTADVAAVERERSLRRDRIVVATAHRL